MSEQMREDEEQGKQVPDYAKRYADKFFELKEKSLREYSTDRELGLGLPLVISAIVVIIAGIVYGVAFRTTFLSFGIFCLICLFCLAFSIFNAPFSFVFDFFRYSFIFYFSILFSLVYLIMLYFIYLHYNYYILILFLQYFFKIIQFLFNFSVLYKK